MADVIDVQNALCAIATQTLYQNGTGNASLITAPVKVYPGWPAESQLDADLVAGIVNVSVFPLPTERNTTRYPKNDWQDLAYNTPTLTLTISGQQITVGGTIPSAPFFAQNAMVMVDGVPYVYATQAGDTLSSIATALAALIPGASSVGAVITFQAAQQGTSGTAQAGAASSLTLNTLASAVQDAYAPMRINILGGTGAGQSANVVSSRKNLLRYTETLSNAVWTKQAGAVVTQISGAEWQVDLTACAVGQGVFETGALGIGALGYYTIAADLKIDTSSGTNQIQINDPTGNDGTIPNFTVTLTSNFQRFSGIGQNSAVDRARGIWFRKLSGGINIFRVRFPQVEAGQVATTYIHTEANAAVGVAVDVPWVTLPDSTSVYKIPDLRGDQIQAARIGTVGTRISEVRRQERVFMVTVWAPTPALRDAAASAIDVALAATSFLTLADSTAARLIYRSSMVSDASQKAKLYRRDLNYSVEYATIQTETDMQITQVQINEAAQAVQALGAITPTSTVTTNI